MTKPKDDDDASTSWGTWEELILAFAVNRHGIASWDSIASELRKRTSVPNLSLTAHNCRSKYLDLKRRFFVAPDDSDLKSGVDESAAPLLEELRKLRVAELRREVERYDLNIESLELKVKRMEEERQRSFREKSSSDLENGSRDEKRDVDPVAEPVVREEIDKYQLSVNESNSTDPEADKSKTGDKESEPAGTGPEEVGQDLAGRTSQEPDELKPELDRTSGLEDSCNGSSNSIEKSDRKANKEPVTDSADLAGSEAGGEAAKENSDVQSTASRSRKEGGDKVRRGNTSGDEREHEDQSRAVKELSAQSQPLFDFLQAIRAHKLGSIFQRRLCSQETSKYEKLILQHVDLETIEKRLRQGRYSAGSRTKFFRDLLLLVNNALVYFPNSSPESNAALEIRVLVSKQISSESKSDSSSLHSLSKKDQIASPSNHLILKPRLPSSLIVCRKWSSNADKDQLSPCPVDEKESKNVSDSSEEPKITKKRTRDNRFSPARTKKNIKNSNNNNNQSNSNSDNAKQHGKGGGLTLEQKNNNGKKTLAGPHSKKRGAANFLSRMKQGSSPLKNGDLLDALKNMPLTGEGSSSKGGGLTEKKKSKETVKCEEKKGQVTRRSTEEARMVKEKGGPAKRNVGRPKRGAAPSLPPAVAGKKVRERSENETPPSGKQPKKRRKL